MPKDLQKLLSDSGGQANAALPLAPFVRVRLTGRYGEEMFFLDNQISDGQVGYWLFQTFIMTDGDRVLVNRGFSSTRPTRCSTGGNSASEPGDDYCSVWPDLGLPPLLKQQDWAPTWPKRIQRRELLRMAEAAQSWASELRLEPGQAENCKPRHLPNRYRTPSIVAMH